MNFEAARGAVIPLLCCATALFGQDARVIIEKTVHRDQQNYKDLQAWTYKVSDRIEKLDGSGMAKKIETTVDEVLYIGGKPYIHPLEKDGKPLPANEAAREQAKLDKAAAEAAGLTEEERRKREQQTAKEREKNREIVRYLPDAYTFRLLGEDVVNGRPAWRISAAPLPSYKGKYAFILRNLEGTLWIDREDFMFAKGDVRAIRGFSIGLFLASLSEGAHLYFENMRLNDGIWVTRRAGVEASARVLIRRVRQNERSSSPTSGNFRAIRGSFRPSNRRKVKNSAEPSRERNASGLVRPRFRSRARNCAPPQSRCTG